MSDHPLRLAILPVTAFQQNCSLVWCTKTMRGAFVDPGGDLPRLKAAAEQAGVTIEKILVTHGHIDHCGAAGILADELGVPIEGPMRPTCSGSPAFTRMAPSTTSPAGPLRPHAGWSTATR